MDGAVAMEKKFPAVNRARSRPPPVKRAPGSTFPFKRSQRLVRLAYNGKGPWKAVERRKASTNPKPGDPIIQWMIFTLTSAVGLHRSRWRFGVQLLLNPGNPSRLHFEPREGHLTLLTGLI